MERVKRLGLRERKKQELRDSIRRVAIEKFKAASYDEVSIDDIAEAANVSRSTFFNYFPNKEAVIFSTVEQDRELWADSLNRPLDEPLWDSITGILLEFAAKGAQHIAEVREMVILFPELLPRALSRSHPFYEDLKEFVSQRTRPGGELHAALLLNVALAAAETAYQLYDPAVPFSSYLELSLECLENVREGVATLQSRAS